ncbi:TetR/AcrR family transcriptional regulator [Actinocrispum wychmicini]|uniref:TetR family transcriptional regulator n=1 Tax=Actinocrispum wychmicini TaxID=1213861 RepID=A0A4R2KEV5_9PSEU|nr:TetR/AcrR family transcriptional regulator [Actinocrispum wychmicini]TCO65085.1 TetR family transcriptional regulator [Actinocrispum wychmicini]
MSTESARPQRADARRNRARVLAVAQQVFEAEGLGVTVDDVARRAGVGVGTVYRHFPTKEALFEAIVAARVAQLAQDAKALAAADDPGAAFFDFFEMMIKKVALNKAFGEALSAAGRDLSEISRTSGQMVQEAQALLLKRAQDAGAVRADLTPAELKAVVVGIVTMERHLDGEPGRLTKIVLSALRT